jgi:thiamine monophosphate synthase
VRFAARLYIAVTGTCDSPDVKFNINSGWKVAVAVNTTGTTFGSSDREYNLVSLPNLLPFVWLKVAEMEQL